MPDHLSTLSKLDEHDEAEMAKQIYRLQQANPKRVSVFYKVGAFEINFPEGVVKQQLITEGDVHSLVASRQAKEYESQIKTALALAADIKLLERIQLIPDKAVQDAIKYVTDKMPDASATYILNTLKATPVIPSLTAFGIFRAGQSNDSTVLGIVRKVLNEIDLFYGVTNFNAAEDVWKRIQSDLPKAVKNQTPSNT